MRRHELLQVHRMLGAGNDEELNVPGPGRGVQNPIEHWTDQQILEGVKRAHCGHEQNGRQDLPPVGERIPDKPHQLTHRTPARCRPLALAAGRMDVRCKALFYLSRASVECGFQAD